MWITSACVGACGDHKPSSYLSQNILISSTSFISIQVVNLRAFIYFILVFLWGMLELYRHLQALFTRVNQCSFVSTGLCLRMQDWRLSIVVSMQLDLVQIFILRDHLVINVSKQADQRIALTKMPMWLPSMGPDHSFGLFHNVLLFWFLLLYLLFWGICRSSPPPSGVFLCNMLPKKEIISYE